MRHGKPTCPPGQVQGFVRPDLPRAGRLGRALYSGENAFFRFGPDPRRQTFSTNSSRRLNLLQETADRVYIEVALSFGRR